MSEHDSFWKGEFGDSYTERNAVRAADRVPFFRMLLSKTEGVRRVLELGANRGHNLAALREVGPQLDLSGLEINEAAYKQLQNIEGVRAVHGSIRDFDEQHSCELLLTCGVLIHLAPNDLPMVYRKMAALTDRYVCIVEYFNPVPVEVPYRGHRERLFKRDFAGEFLDANAGLFEIVDYGFLWRRDNPAWDDVNWFLLEKTKAKQ